MWREITPDERIEVDVDGYKVVAYSFGEGAETVFCLNGGPGLPCDYLREAHSCLIDKGYRVVAFDQLGTGAADRPDDVSLWTIERYVEETETVRKALGLGKVHLLGHSWGGWLGIDYADLYLMHEGDLGDSGHHPSPFCDYPTTFSPKITRTSRKTVTELNCPTEITFRPNITRKVDKQCTQLFTTTEITLRTTRSGTVLPTQTNGVLSSAAGVMSWQPLTLAPTTQGISLLKGSPFPSSRTT